MPLAIGLATSLMPAGPRPGDLDQVLIHGHPARLERTALMINVDRLTKRYGAVIAVDGLSFEVGPGRVTGFLGPNGAGKTTTLRMLLGLVAPTSGTATINGARYRDLPNPVRTVGAALDNDCFHPGRSAIEHLKIMATMAGIDRRRPAQVLGAVGLAEDGHRRVGTYSLGMRQRLTLATTLLGDPGVLILDEPLNGLDPDGIRWMRDLLRQLAREGRTVLVSSHLLAEAAQTVDDVVVISRGRLAAEGPVAELTAATSTTRIRTPDTELLMSVLARQQITARLVAPGTVEVRSADPDRVARIAAAASVIVLELTRHTENLEELFFDLTSDTDNDRVMEACSS
jgi:ABC-2 type transport system ATP-binding protein